MLSKPWLVLFAKLGNFFLRFFLEWSAYLRDEINGQPIVWERVPGFVVMAKAMFSITGRFIAIDDPAVTNTLPLAESVLLGYAPTAVLNTFTRMAYARTPLSEIPAVVGTLLLIDFWLGEINKQGKAIDDRIFDADVFCRGLDVILQTDHHLILARLLTMIYTCGDLFRGKARLAVFRDLLLEKHFFHLFLHWSDNVRSIFCQVLAFKFLLTKRRLLTVNIDKHGLGKAKKSSDTPPGSPKPGAAASQQAGHGPEEHEDVLSVDLAINAKLESYLTVVLQKYETLTGGAAAAAAAAAAANAGSGGGKPRKEYHVEEEDLKDGCSAEKRSAPGPRIPDATVTLLPDAMPKQLSVYIVPACEEYKKHMARYNEWQSKGNNTELPNLITMA